MRGMLPPSDFPGVESDPSHRRPFAAKRRYTQWGVVLGIIGGLWLLNFTLGLVLGGGNFWVHLPTLLVAVALGLCSAYLLRGPKVPKSSLPNRGAVFARRSMPLRMPMRMPTAQSAQLVTHAANDLQQARGGAALVAYRRLEATVSHYYPMDTHVHFQRALASIGFNMATLNSPRLGYVPTNDGTSLEVFRDWIIHGQLAYDVDSTTRGRVRETGSIQLNSEVVTDRHGQVSLVDRETDTRAVEVSFWSNSWRMSAALPLHVAADARRLVDEFNAHMESAPN